MITPERLSAALDVSQREGDRLKAEMADCGMLRALTISVGPANAEIERLTAALAQAEREMDEARKALTWQPIDTAPEGVPIQIGYEGCQWVATGEYTRIADDEAGRVSSHATLLHYNGTPLLGAFYATHWMPLPAPPPERKRVRNPNSEPAGPWSLAPQTAALDAAQKDGEG